MNLQQESKYLGKQASGKETVQLPGLQRGYPPPPTKQLCFSLQGEWRRAGEIQAAPLAFRPFTVCPQFPVPAPAPISPAFFIFKNYLNTEYLWQR